MRAAVHLRSPARGLARSSKILPFCSPLSMSLSSPQLAVKLTCLPSQGSLDVQHLRCCPWRSARGRCLRVQRLLRPVPSRRRGLMCLPHAGALTKLQEQLGPARSEVYLGKVFGRLLFLPGAQALYSPCMALCISGPAYGTFPLLGVVGSGQPCARCVQTCRAAWDKICNLLRAGRGRHACARTHIQG